MVIYLFDGTFEGLLTAIYESYYSKPHAENIYNKHQYKYNLLDDVKYIDTDLKKYEKVYEAIEKKISKNALNKIYLAYLSDMHECYSYIYRYVVMGFKVGNEIDLYKNNDIVIGIDNFVKKVSLERHRMMGFVRFKSFNNILISKINPTHNVLELIAKHFSKRLSNENFIIYDENRDLALVYNKSGYYITDVDDKFKKMLESIDDNFYETLWSEYFNSVNIAERENKKLQSRMMPKRYWKNLSEVSNTESKDI
ncbi:TIGR03915 family putative DNA repair protein [Paraclostridium ghonii]|uniref:DNA metabolism protein n=1 Tax=Paraclostridium ghonii TaxID=29358 RepID=A0ABU0MYC2_9FIRM|nr:TIGR03915 family putative DNA repair protein [Paeniclostridium ghonii]MDQ0555917.1 putative DNA metabolism protein [Paeniclostridium ghonii]